MTCSAIDLNERQLPTCMAKCEEITLYPYFALANVLSRISNLICFVNIKILAPIMFNDQCAASFRLHLIYSNII